MIKEYENQLEEQFTLSRLTEDQLMNEIRTSFSVAVGEMELQEAAYNQIVVALGTPEEFIRDYLEGRGLGEVTPKTSIINKSNQVQKYNYKMHYRELQIIDFKISQNIILILLIIPSLIALSVIPIFFVPIFSYYTLYETWGIDDTFIGIFFIMFFPFWFEILTGVTGKQPLNIKKMEILRNSYRLSYLLIHVSFIVSFIWQDIRGVWIASRDAYPIILFFEFFIIVREVFLTPLNLANGFERKESYKFYLAFLILSFLIVPGVREL